MSLNTAQDIKNDNLSINYRICNEELNREECNFDFNDCCNFIKFQPHELEPNQKQWKDVDGMWYKSCNDKDPDSCKCIGNAID